MIVVLALSVTACGGSSKDDGRTVGVGHDRAVEAVPGRAAEVHVDHRVDEPARQRRRARRAPASTPRSTAVNRTCSLGRPLEVNICDDKADTNANLACGRKAGSDGSLAILGSIGTFDDGVTASKLPAIFVNGTSPFELTNENAYSSVNGIALGISGTSAIKARGKKSSTLVLPDTPTLQFAGELIVQMAALLDVKVDPIYFPQDTTDFAPVAAQISEADDEAVGMLPLNPVVMVNALAQEGITPENHDMVVPGGVITPEVVEGARRRGERHPRRERDDAADGDEQRGHRGVPCRHGGRRARTPTTPTSTPARSRRGRT